MSKGQQETLCSVDCILFAFVMPISKSNQWAFFSPPTENASFSKELSIANVLVYIEACPKMDGLVFWPPELSPFIWNIYAGKPHMRKEDDKRSSVCLAVSLLQNGQFEMKAILLFDIKVSFEGNYQKIIGQEVIFKIE